jgi:beta-lactam-binding protein with PASTA domain
MVDVSPAVPAEPARKVRVPELVGVPATDAHDRALDAGVLAVAENATHTAAGRGLISRQHPDPGAEVDHGAIVRIWIGS